MTLAWLLLACASDPCARYGDLPFARERCRVVQAAQAPDIASARCEEAGGAEEDCRLTWVETHLELPIDTLLAACTTPECRFVALDFRPSPLREQLTRCDALGALAGNCGLHAFVRYFAVDPPLATQSVDLAALGAWSALAAEEAGFARGCGHAVDCAVFGADAASCESPPARPIDCSVYRANFPRRREGQTRASP